MSGNNIELIRIHVKELPASVINDGDAIYEKALKEGYDTLRDNGMDDYDEASDSLVRNAAEYKRMEFLDKMRKTLSDILTQVRGFELGSACIPYESDEPELKIKMTAILLMMGDSREQSDDAYKVMKKMDELNIDWHDLTDFADSLRKAHSLFNDITAIPTSQHMVDAPRTREAKPVAPGQRRPAPYKKPVKGEM